MRKMVTRQCENCNASFDTPLKSIKGHEKEGKRGGVFCSNRCSHEYRLRNYQPVAAPCANCGDPVERRVSQAKKSKNGNIFCSRSCAATYNNTHKTTGTRRSKLEAYIEEQLRSDFPNLTLICNGKDAIGSELDFYFPQLRLAIELNGILHYEPIYGPDKLERIQANDQQKYATCTAAGIELCIIDSSSVNRLTKFVKERYYPIVRGLVVRLIGRADDTNVQVP